MMPAAPLKDEILNHIVEQGGNIAQFASFAPDGTQRFARIRGVNATERFASVKDAALAMTRAGVRYMNIRSFSPGKHEGNPFFLGREGFETPDKIAAKAHELMARGLYVIINEEIDINDGGFSGVLLGNIAEFATRDTPRCVEKPGCAALPRLIMLGFARIVYSQRINIPYDRGHRVEFSVHPGPVGYARQHQIIWQIERVAPGKGTPEPTLQWPNRVSEDMGDKAYGLLMAHLCGFLVPYTKVIGRIIPPFEFGEKTKSPEPYWRRTCPRLPEPGLFATKHGQVDPFALMQEEDPRGSKISSIIFQDDVEAVYSGAAITDAVGGVVIEGKAGRGDGFMLGMEAPDMAIPDHVLDAVENIWTKAREIFGPVQFEWCYDRTGTVWIVQFHVRQAPSVGDVICPGEPEHFEIFKTDEGLEALRVLAKRAKREGFGIVLEGEVGITSHFGDILRRDGIPSKLKRAAAFIHQEHHAV